MRPPAISILARAPVAGHVKTRLIPLLGVEGAAKFHRALLQDTLSKIARLPERVAKHVFLTPPLASFRVHPKTDEESAFLCGTQGFPRQRERSAPSFRVHLQRGRGLGRRLENALDDLFRAHAPVLIIGADSPLIPASRFALALEELKTCDAVLGPCEDGGYYLIGLRRPAPGVHRGVRWGGRFAFRDTLRNLLCAELSCSILEMGSDVDTPQDFARLEKVLKRSSAARRLAPVVWQFVKELRRRKDADR